MRKTKTIQKIMSIISVSVSIFVIFTCMAFALTKDVQINTNHTVRYSDDLAATKVKYSGRNNASSKRALYFHTEYMNSNGKFTKSDTTLMGVGQEFSYKNDNQTTFIYNVIWRLELNPYGLNTRGCSGYGYISSR